MTHQKVVINLSIINNQLTSLDSNFLVEASFNDFSSLVWNLPGEKELKRGSAPGSEVVRDSSETLGSHYSLSEVKVKL